MATLEKVAIFRGSDDSVKSRLYFISEAIRDGVTENQFIASEISKFLQNSPEYSSYQIIIKNRADLKSITAETGTKRSLKCDSSGRLYNDMAYIAQIQARADMLISLREKIKTELSITDQEVRLIL